MVQRKEWRLNPRTGRHIVKDGYTWNLLKGEGVNVNAFKKVQGRYAKSPRSPRGRKSPRQSKFENMTVKELREKCKKKNITGYSGLNKKELVKACSGKKRRKSPNVAKQISGKELAKTVPRIRKYRRMQLRASQKEGEGRGSPTRGWVNRAPQKGRERHTLMNKCGKKCFLGPNESYPVCAALRTGQGCKYDCGGVQAAYNRSRQYGKQPISRKAKNLLKKECGQL